MDKKNQDPWKKAVSFSIFIFALCFAYAAIRYNLVRNTPIDQLPLYINNKAIALSSTILIGISFLLGPLARFLPGVFGKIVYLRKNFGLIGFFLATLHVIMTLVLFNKANYPRYFLENGKLTFNGETALLFGILAVMVFGIVSIASLPSVEERMEEKNWKTIQRLGYLAYIFVLLHVSVMGYKGWSNPESYQYGMASITLISALFIVFVLIMRLLVVTLPKK